MKKTTNNAEYILMTAIHIVDWEKNCFVLFQITNEWREEMKKRLDTLVPFIDDKQFYDHCYYYKNIGYFIKPGNKHLPDEIITGKEDWCFVELEENDKACLFKNENFFLINQVVIDRHKQVWINGNDINIENEFFTWYLQVAELFLNEDLTAE
jgi:hypothetical protein